MPRGPELLILAHRYEFGPARQSRAMTQSDYDFVGQLVENRFSDPLVRLRPFTVLASWYFILIAGALVAGAVIGFTT